MDEAAKIIAISAQIVSSPTHSGGRDLGHNCGYCRYIGPTRPCGYQAEEEVLLAISIDIASEQGGAAMLLSAESSEL